MREKTRQKFLRAIGAENLSKSLKNSASQLASHTKAYKAGHGWKEVIVPLTNEFYIEVRFCNKRVEYTRLKRATKDLQWLINKLKNPKQKEISNEQ